MPRIKKRGLDYFPMNTDFIHDRMVRRIMKREGDAALSILLGTLSCVYSGEGYYVRADELFYDDLSDCLFQQEADDVRRVVALAVEYGLFHGDLFARYGILTSADIQRQFLFSTKRRDTHLIDPAYLLLEPGELNALASGGKKKTRKTAEGAAEEKTLFADGGVAEAGTQSARFNVENADSMYLGTHSIAQQSIAQQSEAQNSTEQQTTAKTTVEDERGKEGSKPLRELTAEDLDRLSVPQDGQKRNLAGLLESLRQNKIPVAEQYAIILKSNFGIIGHPVWKGVCTLRESHGKIRLPGRYLLSLINRPNG